MVKEKTVGDLKQLIDTKQDFTLIDVREPFEKEIADIGGALCPVGKIDAYIAQIPKDRLVVVYCRSGVRSARAIKHLMNQYGYSNIFNLKGGILTWADEIDSSIEKY